MSGVVIALVVGILLVTVYALSDELKATRARWSEQQEDLIRSKQALVMLTDLYVPIAEMVEILMVEDREGRLSSLAWEVLERHKAACEFARGKRV